MSPEQKNAAIRWITVVVLSIQASFGLGWYLKPASEPDSWCPKRLYGYYLTAERLDVTSYSEGNGFGTLMCKLERPLKVAPVEQEYNASEASNAKPAKKSK